MTMDDGDLHSARSREVAITLLGLARPLLERAGDRLYAAEVAHLIYRLRASQSEPAGPRTEGS